MMVEGVQLTTRIGTEISVMCLRNHVTHCEERLLLKIVGSRDNSIGPLGPRRI